MHRNLSFLYHIRVNPMWLGLHRIVRKHACEYLNIKRFNSHNAKKIFGKVVLQIMESIDFDVCLFFNISLLLEYKGFL